MGVMVVVVGPEKAGKSTLVHALQKALHRHGWRDVRRYKQSGPMSSLGAYMPDLRESVAASGVSIWDRAWPCECVYSRLTGRPSPFGGDEWLAEWVYGRAADIKLCLLGPSDEDLESRRDETDLDVEVHQERELYRQYATRFGWETVEEYPDQDFVEGLAERVLTWRRPCDPPDYVGPPKPKVVVVGEARNDGSAWPGYFLPFTTRTMTAFGRLFGDRACRLGWMNAANDPAPVLDTARVVIAAGRHARAWVSRQPYSGTVLEVPHPGYALRWGRMLDEYQYPTHLFETCASMA